MSLIKAMLGMLGGGENICGWLVMMELLPLGYHWHKEMRKLISVRGRTLQLDEPLLILTACLFSFVVGERTFL